TSIHLIMMSAMRLVKFFPSNGIKESNVNEYNQQTVTEIERIRDFVILHYHATQRDDTDFWRYCKNMDIPEALAHRVQLFKDTAAIALEEKELFLNDSWVQVMMGQGIMPTSYHPIADVMDEMELKNFLGYLKKSVGEKVAAMPSHQELINRYCKAPAM
ncbi:MAG: tryptophan halogenase, partial [Sphingobacteriales bacterium]